LTALAVFAMAGSAFAAAPETSPRPVQGPELRVFLGCDVWRPAEKNYWVKTDPACAFSVEAGDGAGGFSAPSRIGVSEAVRDALEKVAGA
jgi:hypothetical protein